MTDKEAAQILDEAAVASVNAAASNDDVGEATSTLLKASGLSGDSTALSELSKQINDATKIATSKASDEASESLLAQILEQLKTGIVIKSGNLTGAVASVDSIPPHNTEVRPASDSHRKSDEAIHRKPMTLTGEIVIKGLNSGLLNITTC